MARSSPRVLLALLLIGGCSGGDPRAKVASYRQAYTLALGTASDEREAGRMSDDAYRRFDVAQSAADAFLTGLETRAATSQPTVQADLDAAAAMVQAMQSALKGG